MPMEEQQDKDCYDNKLQYTWKDEVHQQPLVTIHVEVIIIIIIEET